MQIHGFQKKKITSKDSLGSRLKSKREKQNITLDSAEHETKIRSHYLKAMEDSQFEKLPESHRKGFVRQYATYLGFDAQSIASELSYLVPETAQKQIFSPGRIEKETKWLITPRLLGIATAIIVLVGFVGYVTYQVRQFAAPPNLVITKPNNESVVAQETFTIEGKTEPGVVLYIDNLQASVNSSGDFSYPLTLRPGLNQVTVKAENRIKKQVTRVISILYQQNEAQESGEPVSVSKKQ